MFKAMLAALVVWMGAALPSEAPRAEAPQDRYAVGQVWEYRTRPQDAGSLVVIREIEPYGPGRVYHVSIIGLKIGDGTGPDALDHTPVSRETLDASVTRLSDQRPELPDFQEGVADWRAAEGGVFTIPLAEIAGVVDDQVSRIRGK